MPLGAFLDSFPPALFIAAGFLGFFGGVITMKMAVLVEQTLMVLLVVAVTRKGRAGI